MNEKTPEQIKAESEAADATAKANAKAADDKAKAEAAQKATDDAARAKAADEAKAAEQAKAQDPAAAQAKAPLRTDGPTLEEYVKAGHSADTYPPAGYAARDPAPLNNVSPTVTIDPSNPDSVLAQHEAVDEKMAKLNEHNEAGAAKIAEAEQAVVEASKSIPHVPTGKEWNRNTPVIDEFGNKQW
jgi:colicin import membrane protein